MLQCSSVNDGNDAQSPGDFTQALKSYGSGDKSALDRLTPIVYKELRKLASARLRSERPDHTLQATALVHEAYVRLVGREWDQWESRTHFFSVASHIMRQILVDHARKHDAAKRSSGEKVALDEAVSFAPERGAALLAMDDALREMAKFDERKSKLIELKYFGGLTSEELATALDISVATVTRESRLAEAWLRNYLTDSR